MAGTGFSGSTDGPGDQAKFKFLAGVTTDGTDLYVVDRHANNIRIICLSTNEVATTVGTENMRNMDCFGSYARFNGPYGITPNTNYVFISDENKYSIRRIE